MGLEVDEALKFLARRVVTGLITPEGAYRVARDHLEFRERRSYAASEVFEALAGAIRNAEISEACS